MHRAKFVVSLICLLAFAISAATPAVAQSTTGTIQGTVRDNQDAVVPGATVTVRNVQTNATRSGVTDAGGFYRFLNMPVGQYEVIVELAGFGKHTRSGITLSLNQDAVVDVQIQPAGIAETVQVTADAPLLNTTTPEVGVRFNAERIAELPVSGASFRDVFAVALSAPGVSQLGAGQTGFASGTNFSSNGMRVRSNNFMIDGQDSNDPSVTGRQQPINNTDTIQEVRLITNQFAAEFGRAAGLGGQRHHQERHEHLPRVGVLVLQQRGSERPDEPRQARRPGVGAVPREEAQYGGTVGGPILRNKTFFFGSYQRWTDEQLGSGLHPERRADGQGRAILQSIAGGRPQIAALLNFVPAGAANGRSASFTLGGQSFTVPLGDITGSSSILFKNDQATARVDHQFTPNHIWTTRYLLGRTPENSGTGQVTPPGLTTINTSNQHSINTWLNSVLGQNMSNEFRIAWSHLGTITGAQDPSSETIPSLEITSWG
jgi:hypothetical protein